MNIDPHTGLLDIARQLGSPNCDERLNMDIDLLVIHGISLPPGEFGNDAIDRFFTNQLDSKAHPYFEAITELRVSSHLLIRRDGEVVQYVPFTKRAWHAGMSYFNDRESCNDFSIGIELEGTDELPYEEVQYQHLQEIIQALQQVYPKITNDHIVGHCEIAPGRKTDPGEIFDWSRIR